ncbi:MAG: tetratricopeptide repeat protein [Saprospiraceae bacterium]
MTRIFLLLSFLISTSTLLVADSNLQRIDSLKQLLEAESITDSLRVSLLNQIGYEYWIIDPNQSVEYGQQGLAIAAQMSDNQGIAFANRVIGVAHWTQANYDLAYEYLYAAQRYYEQLADSLGFANTLLNIGMVNQAQKDYPAAEGRYENALRIFQTLQQSSRVATTQTKLGDLYVEIGKLDAAYTLFVQALNAHLANEFQYGIAEVNNKLGRLFIKKNELQSALSYLLQSVEAGAVRNDRVGIADNYQLIGSIYLQKKDYPQAESYLNRSQDLAEEFQLKTIQKEIYQTQKELAIAKGDLPAAVAAYDRYVTVADSLYNEEKANAIAAIRSQFADQQREQELALAEQKVKVLEQQDRIRQLQLALIGLLTILAVIGVSYYVREKNKRLEKQAVELEQARTETGELQTALAAKDKELTAFTLNFVQKNQLLQDIKGRIQQLTSDKQQLKKLERHIDSAARVDADWEDFRRQFQAIHGDLLSQLKGRFPQLTSNDFKLIALIRLNLSTKEMAGTLGISPESAKTARYRLRKKLGLSTEQNLFDFLMATESELMS